MKILANENIPFDSILLLKEKGYDIKSVAVENFGITDKEVLNLSIEEERIIVTFDRDYGELIFKYKLRPPSGVIYLRLYNYTPRQPGEIIDYLLKELQIDTCFRLTVYNGETIRQRQY